MARYALVVGIAEYGGRLTNLDKPVVDGEAIAQILEKHGSFQEVKRLPARWNVQKNCYEMSAKGIAGKELGIALKQFLTEQATRGEALIYFSGHGFTVSDNLGEIKGYLAPSDCILETDGERIVGQHNGIPLDSLNELIRKSDLSSLVVLLDCCNSGYFLERSSIEQTLTAFSSQRDYYLIAACRSFEEAWEGEEYSVFTQALLKGLSPENTDSRGQVSGDRLFDYISTALQGSGQEPIRMGWGRSITLVVHRLQESLSSPEQFKLENPYLGLRAFEADQATYFYGREQAVRALLERLNQGRFLAVIGPSGCGKSSLIKAGLLPELRRDRLPSASQWQIETFTPGEHPHQTLLKILNQHSSTQQLVLFIDQFEEVFTLCEDETERWEFIRQMAEEANRPDRLTRVIIAIRGDFLDRCAPYPETVDLINQTKPTTYVVPPLTPLELEEAIEKPALKNGVSFEPRLVSRIVADVVDRPGALPLLQYALMKLWQACITETNDPQPILTHKGYEKIGGVKGALDQRASSLYRDFAASDRQFVRRLFLELVQLGEGQEVTRRRASWERIRAIADSSEQLQRVIRLLAGSQHRLIITDTKTVEVAHEALLSEWTLLRDWIAADRENIRLGRTLETYCREWQDRFQCSEEALLTGAQLAAIAEWVEQTHPKLTEAEADYVKRSLEKRDRQLQTKLDQERKLREEAEARAKAESEKVKEAKARARAEKRRTQVAIVAGLLVAILLVLIGFLQSQAARKVVQLAKLNEVDALTAVADTYFRENRQLEALVTSVKALKELKQLGNPEDIEKTGQANLNQLRSIIGQIQEVNRLDKHTKEVMDVSFSLDGELIASASWDKTVKVWRKNGELLAELPHENGYGVWGVGFSPNSKLLATADTDGITKIWDWDAGTKQNLRLERLPNYEDGAIRVSFSRDGTKVASSNVDKAIRVWSVTNGELLQIIRDNQSSKQIYGVSFNPNNQTIISSSEEGFLKLWQADSGEQLKTFNGHSESTFAVSFNSSGDMIASGSFDTSVKVWRSSDSKVLYDFKNEKENSESGHLDEVNGVSFSKDSRMVASGSKDGTVKVWSLIDNKLLQTFRGHRASVNSVSFSPSTQTIASASDDGTIRLWSLNRIQTDVNTVNQLIDNSCSWLHDYLEYNSKLIESDRSVCPP